MTFISSLLAPRGVDIEKIRELTKTWSQKFAEGFNWEGTLSVRETEVRISPKWRVDNPQNTRYSRWLKFDSGLLVEEFQNVGSLPDLAPAFEENQFMKVGPLHYLLMRPVYSAHELMQAKRQPVLNIIRVAETF